MNDESSLAIRHQHHYMLILTKIVINERVFLVFVYNYYSSAQHAVCKKKSSDGLFIVTIPLKKALKRALLRMQESKINN